MKKKAILCRHFKKYSYFCTDLLRQRKQYLFKNSIKKNDYKHLVYGRKKH